jgi:hypothetical protein
MTTGSGDLAQVSPIAHWPAWKAIGLCIGTSVLLGGMLWLSALMVPPSNVGREFSLFLVTVVIGTSVFIWSWKWYSWASRVAATGLVGLVFLSMGIRAWTAILDGLWFFVVVCLFILLYLIAWSLPAFFPVVSESLWTEQTSPRTSAGRTIMKWLLRIGVGGAGVIGASAGMSLVRLGGVPIAYLGVALGMSILSVMLAQSFSHQLWPVSPWAKRATRPTLGRND